MSVLEGIDTPGDLKRLGPDQLPALAQEIRDFLLTHVAQTGGHVASSLGAVELVIALDAVFDLPRDKIVWDMGYQAYAHKLLTGRRARFATLKQYGGLSGFSHRDEGPFDLFTTGHGGTAISTALGLVAARDLRRGDEQVVAVIGDASLGEGMAFEALNHAGHLGKDLLVVLNDNRMSIAPSVGGLSRYLTRVIAAPRYNRLRLDVEALVRRVPRYGFRVLRAAKRLERGLKSVLVPGMLFQELGFRYFGPLDGHDIGVMMNTLRNVAAIPGPRLVHVVTKKGKGYRFAEADPERFHKVGPFDLATGEERPGGGAATFTEAMSQELVALAERDRRIVAITAAMPLGTGLDRFEARFPERCFDVGMAEQHALGLAAGLARGGMRPVVAIYATFLQRAYDQIFHDVCIQRLPVVLCLDRASLVGEDGITHHGVFDLAFLSGLPHLAILAPRDGGELRLMLRWALSQSGPVAIRYPRGAPAPGLAAYPPAPVEAGRAEVIRPGSDAILLGLGSMVGPCLEAAERLADEGLQVAVVNARFMKPVDAEGLLALVARRVPLLIVEEAVLRGGFGSQVLECCEQAGVSGALIRRLGLPDRFLEHGGREQLLLEVGLTAEDIVRAVREELVKTGVVEVAEVTTQT